MGLSQLSQLLIILCLFSLPFDASGETCEKTQWKCYSGHCIDSTLICDGQRHCNDGSDETFNLCSRPEFQCPQYSFRCSYGACVDGDAVCNGLDDCLDRSDELQPQCPGVDLGNPKNCGELKFGCASNDQCIDSTKLCDGTPDCDDASDETVLQCSRTNCEGFSFRCAYGACVDGDAPCDGKAQCYDGSDEIAPQCKAKDTGQLSTPSPTIRPLKPPVTKAPPSTSGALRCVLPEHPPNGYYDLYSCSGDEECSLKPGELVRHRYILHYACNDGYRLIGDKEQNEFIKCVNGVWTPSLPTCSNECEPLFSEKLIIRCEDGYKNRLPCDQKMPANSSAWFDCDTLTYRRESLPAYNTIYCKNGRWTPQLKDSFCVVACGLAEGFAAGFIGHGELADPQRFPWHAGIYEQENGTWTQTCAGSLVTPQIVISAAHCFAKSTDIRDVIEKNETEIRVALGKYFRTYDAEDDSDTVQYFKIIKYILPLDYKGSWDKYGDDIAILILSGFAKYTRAVRPVCLLLDETDEEDHLVSGPAGEVVGWGKTSRFDDATEELRYAQIPLVRRSDCKKKIAQHLYPFVTKDKMCGLDRAKNQTVCKGDSGGGYVFYDEDTKQYTLRGVVSAGDDLCTGYEHVLFTRISAHATFLRDEFKKLGLAHEKLRH